jgi:NACalpha-BTF3-like transcription factor
VIWSGIVGVSSFSEIIITSTEYQETWYTRSRAVPPLRTLEEKKPYHFLQKVYISTPEYGFAIGKREYFASELDLREMNAGPTDATQEMLENTEEDSDAGEEVSLHPWLHPIWGEWKQREKPYSLQKMIQREKEEDYLEQVTEEWSESEPENNMEEEPRCEEPEEREDQTEAVEETKPEKEETKYELRSKRELKSTWDPEFLDGEGISEISGEEEETGGATTGKTRRECPYSFKTAKKKKMKRGGRKHRSKKQDAEEETPTEPEEPAVKLPEIVTDAVIVPEQTKRQKKKIKKQIKEAEAEVAEAELRMLQGRDLPGYLKYLEGKLTEQNMRLIANLRELRQSTLKTFGGVDLGITVRREARARLNLHYKELRDEALQKINHPVWTLQSTGNMKQKFLQALDMLRQQAAEQLEDVLESFGAPATKRFRSNESQEVIEEELKRLIEMRGTAMGKTEETEDTVRVPKANQDARERAEMAMTRDDYRRTVDRVTDSLRGIDQHQIVVLGRDVEGSKTMRLAKCPRHQCSNQAAEAKPTEEPGTEESTGDQAQGLSGESWPWLQKKV